MNTQQNTFRRIVTGHDTKGKAIIVSDAPPVHTQLVSGHTVPASTCNLAVKLLGQDGVAELFFLVGGYCLIATILNGFDIPAHDSVA